MWLNSKSGIREEYSAYGMGGENDYILNSNQHCQTLDGPYDKNTTGLTELSLLFNVLCGFFKYCKLIMSVKGI